MQLLRFCVFHAIFKACLVYLEAVFKCKITFSITYRSANYCLCSRLLARLSFCCEFATNLASSLLNSREQSLLYDARASSHENCSAV